MKLIRPSWAGVGTHTLLIYSHTAEAEAARDAATRPRGAAR